MKEIKMDRRINRTRKLMHEALMALIVEKGYEAVTVQDILDRADVGRSTFYAHFRDKDALCLSGFDHLRTLFEQQQQSLLAAKHDGKDPEFNMILELFRHVGQHHTLYKAIAGQQRRDDPQIPAPVPVRPVDRAAYRAGEEQKSPARAN
jgi:AcrR family transcriptional regulator